MGWLPVVIQDEGWEATAEQIDDMFLGDAEIWCATSPQPSTHLCTETKSTPHLGVRCCLLVRFRSCNLSVQEVHTLQTGNRSDSHMWTQASLTQSVRKPTRWGAAIHQPGRPQHHRRQIRYVRLATQATASKGLLHLMCAAALDGTVWASWPSRL